MASPVNKDCCFTIAPCAKERRYLIGERIIQRQRGFNEDSSRNTIVKIRRFAQVDICPGRPVSVGVLYRRKRVAEVQQPSQFNKLFGA